METMRLKTVSSFGNTNWAPAVYKVRLCSPEVWGEQSSHAIIPGQEGCPA